MKLATAASAAILLACATTAVAADYGELRRDHASVDAAVAALPDSGLHGALNALSATVNRAQLRPGQPLAAATERRLAAALDRVTERYLDGALQTSPVDQYALLQVLDLVAFDGVLALYDSSTWTPCHPAGSPCGNPAPIEALDRLAQAMSPSFGVIADAYDVTTGGDPLYPPSPGLVPDDMLDATIVPMLVDELRGTFGLIHGVENIDG